MAYVTTRLLVLAAVLIFQVRPVETSELTLEPLPAEIYDNTAQPVALGALDPRYVDSARASRPSTVALFENVAGENGQKAFNSAIFVVPEAFYGLHAVSTYRDLADSLGIVVNRSNPVDNLSSNELRRIFLGEQSHWSNGRRVTVVMLEPGKQERQAVLTQVCQMDDKEFNKHFSEGLSNGQILAAPKTLSTSTEVLRFVSNVPGAIGYLRVTEADDSVKVVHVDSRLPGDKDYGIRLHPKTGKP